MDAERWDRVQSLFNDAASLPESDRAAFLERECHGDPGLLEGVRTLLEEDARGSPLLDAGLGNDRRRICLLFFGRR